MALLLQLKKYRQEESTKRGIALYELARDYVLEDIARSRPQSIAELETIEKFGPALAENYGEDILRIIREHSKNTGYPTGKKPWEKEIPGVEESLSYAPPATDTVCAVCGPETILPPSSSLAETGKSPTTTGAKAEYAASNAVSVRKIDPSTIYGKPMEIPMEIPMVSGGTGNEGIVTTPYTPGAIISAYNYALQMPMELKTVSIRGVYKQNPKNQVYNGMVYDDLSEEHTEEKITILVPVSLRNNLKDNMVCTVKGYLGRRVQKYGTISIRCTVTEIVNQEKKEVDPVIAARQRVLEAYHERTFPNPEYLLRDIIASGTSPKIAAIVGQGAITDKDVQTALGTAYSKYSIDFIRTNLSSVPTIVGQLRSTDVQGYDLMAIIRGGGSGLEVFDDTSLLEEVIQLDTPLVTAIGHDEDSPFIEKVCCKSFSTPTSLGIWLKDLYEHVTEDLEKSKAALVENVKKQYQETMDFQAKRLQDSKKDAEEARKSANEFKKLMNEAKARCEKIEKDQKILSQKHEVLLKEQYAQKEEHLKNETKLREQIAQKERSLQDESSMKKQLADIEAKYKKELAAAKSGHTKLILAGAIIGFVLAVILF